MRIDTEDLLTIRDGEPIDAERKAQALADADHAGELARLEHVKRALRELPELAPPAEAWHRIAAAIDGPAPPARLPLLRIAAAVALAAVIVAAAGAMLGRGGDATPVTATVLVPEPRTGRSPSQDAAQERALRMAEERGEQPAQGATERRSPMRVMSSTNGYAPLVVESARLERVLAQLRAQPQIMNAGTAGTIAGLEDTLAALDEQLTFAAAGGVGPAERETLWRERVNVMNALVQVRYAQAQRTAY